MPHDVFTSPADRPRRRWKPWLLAAVALAVVLLIVDYWAYPYGQWERGRSLNRGENGLWLHYSWYFGRHTPADTQAMAQRLRQQQVRYAYFHVRAIRKDGTLAYRKPEAARQLIQGLRQAAPSVRAIAWVYVGNDAGGGRVDLSRTDVRRAMVRQAVWLTTVCGFDEVQWDYEICPDGDVGLLTLLRETRAALGPAKILSVATPLWAPAPLRHWTWSDGYFTRVAALCDQIVVMGYDSGCWLPRTYVWLLHQQVVHVTQDAAHSNPHCRVLIGIPTYPDRTWSHSPHAENIRMALLGVRDGLADPQADPRTFAGIAPFADYTTLPADWQIYDRLWLGPVSDRPARH